MKFCNVLFVIIFFKLEEKFIKVKICKLNIKNCLVLLCICGLVNLNICLRLEIIM